LYLIDAREKQKRDRSRAFGFFRHEFLRQYVSLALFFSGWYSEERNNSEKRKEVNDMKQIIKYAFSFLFIFGFLLAPQMSSAALRCGHQAAAGGEVVGGTHYAAGDWVPERDSGSVACRTSNDFKLSNYDDTGIAKGTVGGIIANVLQWCLYILGFLAILGFVVSGIFYIMAAGDESMAEKGKTGMVNSIIGVIVALLGYIVLNTVMAVLNAQNSGLGGS
jgi:hypothetical protein